MHGGESNEDRVDNDKQMDASKIIPLLQAIFTMLLFSGKSQLSQPSLHSHPQPEVSRFPCSPSSHQIQCRVCCKVTTDILGKVSSVVNTAIVGVAWLKRTCVAFYSVKKRMRSCALISLDWVRILFEGL